jgi:uncharacterized RDD family membrane protein YckC
MNLAGWGPRVGAYIIDLLPVWALTGIGYAVGVSTDPATGAPAFGALYWVFSLLGIAVWAFNRWFQAGSSGQSWGKKALGLKLLKESTGQPIGFGMALVRDLLHVLDGICFIGYLFPLWDAKKQTFSDKIVSTVVVK